MFVLLPRLRSRDGRRVVRHGHDEQLHNELGHQRRRAQSFVAHDCGEVPAGGGAADGDVGEVQREQGGTAGL